MKDRIKQIRTHFGLTQEQFAKRIKKTTGFISNVETNRCGCSNVTIQTICSVFGVDETWLRDGAGDMFPVGEEKAAADIDGTGERIKEIRKRERLTQEQFGEKIGFSKNYIYYVETGKNIPSDDFLNSVSCTFGVNFAWLKKGEGNIEMLGDPVDDRLIEWLRKNPDVARELRICGGLD